MTKNIVLAVKFEAIFLCINFCNRHEEGGRRLKGNGKEEHRETIAMRPKEKQRGKECLNNTKKSTQQSNRTQSQESSPLIPCGEMRRRKMFLIVGFVW